MSIFWCDGHQRQEDSDEVGFYMDATPQGDTLYLCEEAHEAHRRFVDGDDHSLAAWHREMDS